MSAVVECSMCGRELPGFGVIYGMVCTDLAEDGSLRDLIFCYEAYCRDAVLFGLVNFPLDPTRCTDDNVELGSRAVSSAMLLSDIPANSSEVRYMQMCYESSRERLLGNAGLL